MEFKMKYLFIILALLISSTSMLFSQINVEELRRTGKESGVTFTLGTDITIKEGITDKIDIEPNIQLDYNHKSFNTFIYLSGEYSESNNVLSDNNVKVHYRFIYNLTDLLHPEIFLQSEYDEFILLKERELAGGGIRLQLINFEPEKDSTSLFGLSFGIGAMYEYELINSNPDYTNNNIRLTNYLSFKWHPAENFICASTTYYQPKVNDFSNVKVYSEIEFAVHFGKYFAFAFDLTYKYHSKPPTGIKTYQVEITNGIKVFL
jgi:hypothetical protein